jgi:hypothetical protein
VAIALNGLSDWIGSINTKEIVHCSLERDPYRICKYVIFNFIPFIEIDIQYRNVLLELTSVNISRYIDSCRLLFGNLIDSKVITLHTAINHSPFRPFIVNEIAL